MVSHPGHNPSMANPRPTLKPQLARHVSSVEILAFRTGIFLQPWLCLAMLAENVLDIHRMHMTYASTIITSVISGAIVYILLAHLARRFPREAWIPKVAACRRNLGLGDAIPLGLRVKLRVHMLASQGSARGARAACPWSFPTKTGGPPVPLLLLLPANRP